jgi:hypothetical protein
VNAIFVASAVCEVVGLVLLFTMRDASIGARMAGPLALLAGAILLFLAR